MQDQPRWPTILLTALIVLGTSTVVSAGEFWVLEESAYFDALQSEPRAANIKVSFPAWSDEFEYMQESGRRLVWDISLGKEMPIVGYRSRGLRGKELRPGAYGVGLWLVIGWHMAEDFKDESAPIINTDYRFGGTAKFQRTLQRGMTEFLGGGFEANRELSPP